MTARSFGQRGLASPQPRAPAVGVVRTAQAEIRPAEVVPDFDSARNLTDALPLLTIGLILFLFGIYGFEAKYAFDWVRGGEPGLRSLIAFGGASYDRVVGSGEWWRVFLAPLLHGNMSHIIGNSVALGLVGMRLEPMTGRAWFALIFVLGALGGIAGSLIGNPHGLVTVGASGAITGLIGALFAMSFHHRAEPEEQQAMRRTAVRFGVPALAPLVIGHMGSGASMQVDYYAHLGGALAGGALGWMLCEFWDDHRGRPRLRRWALIASLAALGGSVLAAAFAVHSYGAQAERARQFIPVSEIPPNLRANDRRSAELLARYPNDPRSHIIRAIYLSTVGKTAPVEDELRSALALAERAPVDVPARDSAKTMLALVLADEGRLTAAKAMVADFCHATDNPARKQILDRARLCD